MKKWFKRLKNEKGMTLVELLAVVVILGIVAAIAVPAVGKIIDNSKDDAHESNALLIINAAKLGVVSGQISQSEIIGGVDLDTLVDKGLLDVVPADPSNDGNSYSGSSSEVSFIKGTAASNGVDATKDRYVITLTGKQPVTYYSGISEEQIQNGTKPTTP